MKTRRLLLSLVTLLVTATAWADVTINSTNFPDENFRSWLQSQSYGSDGKITTSEIASIKSIEVPMMNISSLKGIEYFTALEKLDCRFNKLTWIDVTRNAYLVELNCAANELTSINIKNNSNLEILICGMNSITSFELYSHYKLKELYCGQNAITSMIVDRCTALEKLVCNFNDMTSLKVANCSSLEELDCRGNLLTSLDLRSNYVLHTIYCQDNKLSSLYTSATATTQWRETGKSYHIQIYCQNNQLKGTAVDELLKNILMSDEDNPYDKNNTIYFLGKGEEGNELTLRQACEAYKGQWDMMCIRGSDWQPYKINIDESEFPDANFRRFLCDQTYGVDMELTLEEAMEVEYLYVHSEGIKSLKGIENFPNLKKLGCADNQLEQLDVTYNTALQTLDCYQNQLTSLDVSKNTLLTTLDFSDNQLTSIDVSKNTALNYFSCSNNQFSSLDLSKNTALTKLFCSDNQISSLDLTQNTLLKTLYCGNNQLTTLILPENAPLEEIRCQQNFLSGESMETFVTQLPKVGDGMLYVLYDETETNNMSYVQYLTAFGKGWTIYKFGLNGNDWWQKYYLSLQIDETNFPDVNFRNWLLEQDYGSDGVLTPEEIVSVKSIDVSGKGIKDLTGIENFVELISLNSGYNRALFMLDLSHNKKLKELLCIYNKLTTLDLSECKELTYLRCEGNIIRGTGMTKLVESLPTVTSGDFYVCFEGEPNTTAMTFEQVAAAKAKGWKLWQSRGGTVTEYEGEESVEPIAKCATPTISCEGGKLSFDCETEGVEYVYNMVPLSATSGSGNDVSLPTKYRVTVYATKSDYQNSDVATTEVSIGSTAKKGDVNEDGEVNVGDLVVISNIMSGKDE